MTPERWRRVTALFHEALGRAPEDRAAFLEDACRSDRSLKADVEALLSGDDRGERQGDALRQHTSGLAAGDVLGPYRIEAPIDAGGMGEVYTAVDTRLNRTVAIKVLPASLQHDPALRQRFEREAQAVAALNHPNICVLHDVGSRDGIDFLVMEYLEGETLERRLRKSALSIDQAVDIAIQVLDALDKAHRAGITHRDFKPGNIMLTRSSGGSTGMPHAKLLDFGLAKIHPTVVHHGENVTAGPTTPPALTAEGMLVGTVQYMAPEQLEGKEADARADLFAFGTVLYEMLTGRKAFGGDSRTSLIAAILRDDPPAMSTIRPGLPAALDRLVRLCLAKDPDARCQSAHDLGLQLRWIRDGVGAPSSPVRPSSRRGAVAALSAVVFAATVTGVAAYKTSARSAPLESSTIRQVTFRHGVVDAARFAPDGQTLIYSAAWEGKLSQIFSMRLDTAESVPLPLPEGTVLSVSRLGELALLTKVQGGAGTLARVPLGAGGPREVLDGVVAADWAPDGQTLAVVRRQGQETLIEYPIARTLFRTSGGISGVRVSPNGKDLAFIELDGGSGAGWVTLIDGAGTARRLSRRWYVCGCLVWSASGDEIWFSASEVGLDFSVHAVARDGRERVVKRSMGSVGIQDVAGDRALLTSEFTRAGIIGLMNGEHQERDLSWLDFSTPKELSSDGGMLLFTESGVGAGPMAAAFVRRTDGSPAVRLIEGTAMALSPDGRWALARKNEAPHPTLLPMGPGQARSIDIGRLQLVGGFAAWLPDGDRIVFTASEPGHRQRVYVQSLAGGDPRAITPEGIRLTIPVGASPDARLVMAHDAAGTFLMYPIDGGQPLPLAGLQRGDAPLRWSADGTSMWLLNRRSTPAQILRLDLTTRKRSLWREIAFPDPAGLDPGFFRVMISADGQSYVYGYARTLTDLYLVQGLR